MHYLNSLSHLFDSRVVSTRFIHKIDNIAFLPVPVGDSSAYPCAHHLHSISAFPVDLLRSKIACPFLPARSSNRLAESTLDAPSHSSRNNFS